MTQVLWDVTASLGKCFDLTVGNTNKGPDWSSQTVRNQFEI